jgi:L-rhamnose mutarotase
MSIIAEDIETYAFALHLRPGKAAEYEKRHDELWPDMRAMLLSVGILHYEIWLHEPSNHLFAHVIRRKSHRMHEIPDIPIARKWRQFMADVLEQRDGFPIREDLRRVFLLSAT